MQSDEQLTAAEKETQEAESQTREAELKADMEQKAKEEMKEKHAAAQKLHKEEIEAMANDSVKAAEKQAKYSRK